MKELFIIGLVLCAYFLPTIIGYNCKKASGIFFLNLLLGWTFLGWVGAFIWAVSGEKE
ncbi:superinfection immunity protein [bacterium]|nr:superinfection immunity protein [bacterium]